MPVSTNWLVLFINFVWSLSVSQRLLQKDANSYSPAKSSSVWTNTWCLDSWTKGRSMLTQSELPMVWTETLLSERRPCSDWWPVLGVSLPFSLRHEEKGSSLTARLNRRMRRRRKKKQARKMNGWVSCLRQLVCYLQPVYCFIQPADY